MIRNTIIRHYSSITATPVISSTVLLARNPVITRDLPAFEKSYYKYQNELWKRLMWTFPKWFYYRGGTLGDHRFKELNKPPVYNNPTMEFTDGRPEIRQSRDRRFKQELRLPKTYKQAEDGSEIVDEYSSDSLSRKINPNSRVTQADEKNDTTSLERKLSRSLYLVISEDNKTWTFPNFAVSQEHEIPLHKVAEDGIYNLGGQGLNYYNVSSKPCHVISSSDNNEFFIKSQIVSGQFKPASSTVKFMWLAKEELPKYLNNDYYNEIQHLLNDI
ncbi:hypothetical protein PSN45_000090 [Yamadazyma tenuis]|uniref:Large ribosomal subunit protein mL46 n=1 Tax=Candida tenuis (strain ATCC 10573 / BCRC 21748 / CBS 615 / JCM 9827 / NBRC 10315 / NRRL Y-1498 / VKM Y-70) TaxID=590646 RepID=G3BAJ5_CANTC|nr:uncharacterized protein CANTEDRAFT_114897 [Yamadazyma tenuis ATCC 10573]EGV61417.1 hypothetical protein CANTEDRAFT_114897 [Yamadazyma tenuis ATCC 10573]WEJ92637.1 hypothetical protein PSN45_000090 [Yamadazyma tenuis]